MTISNTYEVEMTHNLDEIYTSVIVHISTSAVTKNNK